MKKIIFLIFLLSSLIANFNTQEYSADAQNSKRYSSSSTIGTLSPVMPYLSVRYSNGDYCENISWSDIVWSKVNRVEIVRPDLGRAGQYSFGLLRMKPFLPGTPSSMVFGDTDIAKSCVKSLGTPPPM